MKIFCVRRKIVVLQRNGFTLIELLVVIGIIAVLFAVVLIAINPAKRFAEANNARRQSDVRSISDAIAQYITDKRGQTPNYIPETPTCIGNGETLNGNGGREVDPVRDSSGLVGLWHFNANEGKELSDSDLEIHNNAVSLWHFNEGIDQTVSDSKGANNGILGATSGVETSDPAWTDLGRFSKALYFGGNDYVGIPYLFNPILTNFSAEAWIKSNDASATRIIIQQEDGGGTGRTWLGTVITTGYLYSNLGGTNLTSNYNVMDDKWHHVAVVWNGMNRILYADGAEVARDTPVLESSGGAMRIGIGKTGSSPFMGYIDEIAIYNAVLDESIFKEHYDRKIVNDDSIGLNNSNTGGSASSVGRFGESLQFDGVNDSVKINNSTSLQEVTDNSYTFAGWVKTPDSPPDSCSSNNNTCRYGIINRPGWHSGITYGYNKTFRAATYNSTPTISELSSSEFSSGNWHHLLMTIDDSAKLLYFYVDGQPVSDSPKTYSGALMDYVDKEYYIGAGNPQNTDYKWYLKGSIDDVAIWNQAITDVNKIKELSVLCYDLSSYLVPEYLGSIPKDPKTGADADTGYTISKNTGGAITIQAITPEAIDNQTPEIKASR